MMPCIITTRSVIEKTKRKQHQQQKETKTKISRQKTQ